MTEATATATATATSTATASVQNDSTNNVDTEVKIMPGALNRSILISKVFIGAYLIIFGWVNQLSVFNNFTFISLFIYFCAVVYS